MTEDFSTSSVPGDDRDDFPSQGRLAAIDYGTVRIGIAICDPGRILVSPWEVYLRRNQQRDGEYFQNLAKDERVDGFVVGLPIHCDGGESQKSEEARQFATWLAKLTNLPVRLFDERFSTAQAKRRLKKTKLTRQGRKQRLDAVAAQILLEAFLEVQQYTGQIPGESAGSPPAEGLGLD